MNRLFLLAALLVAVPSALGQTFTLEETIPIETASEIQYVDLDGTGNLSLAIASNGNIFGSEVGNLSFLLYQDGQTGADTYSDPITALDGVYGFVGGLEVADLNGDFLLDAVVAGIRTGAAGFIPDVTVFLNQGFPFAPFLEADTLASGLRDARIVLIGDVTGDATPDIIAAFTDPSNIGQLVYYPGDGTGSFGAEVNIADPNRARDVRGGELADLDADGDLDLVVASTTGQEVLAFLNDGTGSFGQPVVLDGSIAQAQSVDVGDLDGDGNLDVAAAGQSSALLTYYLGDGTGGFGPRVTLDAAATGINKVTLADADQDGDVDVFTSLAFSGAQFQRYTNFGGALFSAPSQIATGATPRDIALGDADQDGDLDITTADLGGTVQFFRNDQTPATVSIPSSEFFGADGQPETGEGFRVLAAPVGGLTVADLAEINVVVGVEGQYPGFGDSNLALGFAGPTPNDLVLAERETQPVQLGRGFRWEWPDRNITIPPNALGGGTSQAFENAGVDLTATGTALVADHTVAFPERTSTGNRAFYLLGNPFAEDFRVEPGVTLTLDAGGGTLSSTFFRFDPAAGGGQGRFVPFSTADGNAADDIVSAWQGFVAQVTGGTSAPTFTYAVSGQTTGGSFVGRPLATGGSLVEASLLTGSEVDWTLLEASAPAPLAASAAETQPALSTVGPNPTRGTTSVTLTLDETQPVVVRVVDLLGREVARVLDGEVQAGAHTLRVPAGSFAAGTYLVVVEGRTVRETRRFTVVR
ncbi:MAG: FG-GAP-like repeat-containing protein [Bacteroidota bacterium]